MFCFSLVYSESVIGLSIQKILKRKLSEFSVILCFFPLACEYIVRSGKQAKSVKHKIVYFLKHENLQASRWGEWTTVRRLKTNYLDNKISRWKLGDNRCSCVSSKKIKNWRLASKKVSSVLETHFWTKTNQILLFP